MLSWAEFRGGLLALAGVLVLILLVIAVTPGLPGELLLQSLRFHFLAAGAGLAVLIMLVGARWRGFLLLLIVAAGTAQGAAYIVEFQSRRVDHAEAPLAQFRFLSFNVLNDNPRAAELVDAVLADPPDVMLVMEAPGIADQMARLETVLPYRVGCESPGRCDIALFSRIPLENPQVLATPLLNRPRLVTARITVDGEAVTLVGMHFSKPYHDNVMPAEFHWIERVLGSIAGPYVLSGDFNATSWSDPVAHLVRQADLVPGPWQPATWPVRLGPLGIPIDNMFTRGSAQIMTLRAGENYGSNHRPLWAEIGLYGAD